MPVKQRITDFISYLNLSQGAFEKECGISNGSINNIRVSIGDKNLQKIVLRFPELNPVWLKMGVGEMLLKENENNLTEPLASDRLPKYNTKKRALSYSELEEIVNLQAELVTELKDRVKFQAEMITELLSKIK